MKAPPPPPQSDLDEDDEDEDGEEDEEGEDEDEDEDVEPGTSATRVALDLLRFVWPFAMQQRALGAALLAGLTVQLVYNAAVPLAMRELIDGALIDGEHRVLVEVLVLLAVAGLLASAVGIATDYAHARLTSSIVRDLRMRMVEHLMTLSLRFFSRTPSTDVLQRFSSDVGDVEETVTTAIPWGVVPLVDVLANAALLFVLEWRLALVALLVFPLGLIGPHFIAPRAVSATHEGKRHEAAALSVVGQTIAGQAAVKAFGLEREACSWYRKRNGLLFGRMVRVAFLSSMVERSTEIALLILHIVVVGWGALLAFDKTITVGTLLIFEGVFFELSYGIGYVAQFVPTVVQTAGGLRRVQRLLAEQPDVVDAPDAIELPPVQSSIELVDVSFGYGDGEQPLRGVSLRIAHGERVVIVGPSGSGKSTFLTLLLRLWDPTAGSIRIDGRDLRSVTQSSLRARVGAVFQESVLFDASLRENIRMGRLDATDAEVEEAARAAGVHGFAVAMPDGYDTMVGERGGRLSGGQRQRVAIARALLRNPSILLLDEATSGLDAENESLVLRALGTSGGTRTVILVTHRPEAIEGADRTLRLQGGKLRDDVSGARDDVRRPLARVDRKVRKRLRL